MNSLNGLHFQIYRDTGLKWRWRLWLDDKIIATGHQGYKDYDQAQAEIWHVMEANPQTPIIA
ncbi:DUF1508 domain-containing protein [Avibacterium paragallinarum]|uniref:Uncharacterized protein n=1 Tax=Avibacterium paragallinarum TaxID=728 RepID=A0A377IWA7_AVIPA|nr:DUF1508 domain-containing protein [Avibacterium paragallinarum]POY47745.1 DUF1508 domain-containing protein [Avibacterium paragallinarum]RZN74598.1 DUF1508 domain-containing protein [Avibacterium paragallinarum]WAL56119.1 DUF1508 domain-containing protein [Avibacterium paragallinarum]WAM58642.1 DUF1508 domain-containing protein [Avibacterium paragallinarum]STO91910.1 Uncharacterised protein [Avibacterium paragallinarum]